MSITITVVTAEIGSIAEHLAPSRHLLAAVQSHVREHGRDRVLDSFVSHTGRHVAILMAQTCGAGNGAVHRLARDAFRAGAELARKHRPRHMLLADPNAATPDGAGGAVVELEIEERPTEALLFFAADKVRAGAYNLPLYLAFTDVMNTPGLVSSPTLSAGFRFVVTDLGYTEGDRVIELRTPEEIYDLAALLRDHDRYVVESVWSRATGEQAVAVSKGNPLLLARARRQFPARGEFLAPYQIGAFIGEGLRLFHPMPLMPVRQNSTTSYFDGPPVVSCAAFSLDEARCFEPIDVFDHPFWDSVRDRVARQSMETRRQASWSPAKSGSADLADTRAMEEKREALEKRFKVRS